MEDHASSKEGYGLRGFLEETQYEHSNRLATRAGKVLAADSALLLGILPARQASAEVVR